MQWEASEKSTMPGASFCGQDADVGKWSCRSHHDHTNPELSSGREGLTLSTGPILLEGRNFGVEQNLLCQNWSEKSDQLLTHIKKNAYFSAFCNHCSVCSEIAQDVWFLWAPKVYSASRRKLIECPPTFFLTKGPSIYAHKICLSKSYLHILLLSN